MQYLRDYYPVLHQFIQTLSTLPEDEEVESNIQKELRERPGIFEDMIIYGHLVERYQYRFNQNEFRAAKPEIKAKQQRELASHMTVVNALRDMCRRALPKPN
jgi:hypothetical protein